MNAIHAIIVYFEAWKSQDFNYVTQLWIETKFEVKLYWTCAEAPSLTMQGLKVPTIIEEKNMFLQYWKLYFNITKGTANYCCPDLLSYITTQERLPHGQHAQVNYPRNHKSTKHKLIDYSTKVMTQKIVQTTALISRRIMSELLRSSWSAVPAYLC